MALSTVPHTPFTKDTITDLDGFRRWVGGFVSKCILASASLRHVAYVVDRLLYTLLKTWASLWLSWVGQSHATRFDLRAPIMFSSTAFCWDLLCWACFPVGLSSARVFGARWLDSTVL